ALAVAEGPTISFKAGHLSTVTSEGRALLGHELVHVGQQRAAGRATPQLQPDPEDRARIAKAIQSKKLADLAAISRVTNATVDERLQLIEILNANYQQAPSAVAEYQIVYWHSFGSEIGSIILAHETIWNDALNTNPVVKKALWNTPPLKRLQEQFVADLEQLVTDNLFANREYVVARQEMLGLKGPSPNALSPELLTKLRRNLQDEAYKIYQIRLKQNELKKIQ